MCRIGRLLPALLVVSCILGGCQRTLIKTPYVMYGDAGRSAYSQTPAELRTPEIPIIYVTDRAADGTDERGPKYGFQRSRQLAYGVATVSLGRDVDWGTLVDDCSRADRSRDYSPRVSRIEETGRFADVLTLYEASGGRLAAKSDALETYRASTEGFRAMLDQWLARGARKDVIVFVHGFNNRFDHAVIRMAETWHMSGRVGVPIAYTWPAGSGGLKGYAYDRESGEYTVVHLKMLLLALANHPGVERVHVVSHSRGTDVAVTAIRELHAEVRGAMRTSPLGAALGEALSSPRKTYEVLKLETLVLAAPDMDLDVFMQRFFGENLLLAANRVVVYISDTDEALGLADWLFRSRRRLGAMRLADFRPKSLDLLAEATSLEIVNCKVTGANSHSYLVEHPAALSDLILMLRDGAAPGEPRRSLVHPIKGVWQLDNGYLKPGRDADERSRGGSTGD